MINFTKRHMHLLQLYINHQRLCGRSIEEMMNKNNWNIFYLMKRMFMDIKKILKTLYLL